jgi:hypothetical protein
VLALDIAEEIFGHCFKEGSMDVDKVIIEIAVANALQLIRVLGSFVVCPLAKKAISSLQASLILKVRVIFIAWLMLTDKFGVFKKLLISFFLKLFKSGFA